MKKYFYSSTYITLAVGIVPSLIYAFFNVSFIDSFIACNTLMGMIFFLIGFLIYCGNKGDFDMFSYKKHEHGTFKEYKEIMAQAREGKQNPILYASFIQLIYTTILSILF